MRCSHCGLAFRASMEFPLHLPPCNVELWGFVESSCRLVLLLISRCQLFLKIKMLRVHCGLRLAGLKSLALLLLCLISLFSTASESLGLVRTHGKGITSSIQFYSDTSLLFARSQHDGAWGERMEKDPFQFPDSALTHCSPPAVLQHHGPS